MHCSPILFCDSLLLLYKFVNNEPIQSQDTMLLFSTPALLQALFLGLLQQCMTSSTSVSPCGNNARVITKVLVYENSVYINTDVLSNTTFEVNPDLTITVNHAPTSLDLTTTFTSKQSIYNTLYPSATTLTNVTYQTPFALLIGYTERSRVRRQSGTYLGFNGTLTTTCSTASTYTLSNGQLFEQSNGVTYQFSAAVGVAYEFFAPTLTAAAITTTFSLGENGALMWINPNFFNGNALFCVFTNGSIVAVFAQGAQPVGCDFIDISISDLSGCISNQGPAGPGGPQGPAGVSGLCLSRRQSLMIYPETNDL